jgi:hypothetical protein
MTGAGAAAVETDTLSNVAVSRTELLLALTAKPMYTFCAMVMVWGVPTCVQITPSAEAYPVKAFPMRTSFTQYGKPVTAVVCDADVEPPVVARV